MVCDASAQTSYPILFLSFWLFTGSRPCNLETSSRCAPWQLVQTLHNSLQDDTPTASYPVCWHLSRIQSLIFASISYHWAKKGTRSPLCLKQTAVLLRPWMNCIRSANANSQTGNLLGSGTERDCYTVMGLYWYFELSQTLFRILYVQASSSLVNNEALN